MHFTVSFHFLPLPQNRLARSFLYFFSRALCSISLAGFLQLSFRCISHLNHTISFTFYFKCGSRERILKENSSLKVFILPKIAIIKDSQLKFKTAPLQIFSFVFGKSEGRNLFRLLLQH